MKVFKLLSSLSKQELKLLKKAVLSPLYNTNDNVVCLFEFLRPMHPDFSDTIQTRKKLFKKLFPKEDFYDYKLRQLFSDLTKVIESLLLFIAQETDPFYRKKSLINSYQERGLNTMFQKGVEELLAEDATSMLPSLTYYQRQFELLEFKYFHPLHDKNNVTDDTLTRTVNSLDLLFVIRKLRLVIALKSRASILNETYDNIFLSAIKNAWKKGILKEYLLVGYYLQVLDLFEESIPFDFDVFEKKIQLDLPKFEEKDQKILFFTILNFIIRQFNKGAIGSGKKQFKWYRFGLQQEYLLEQNKINEILYSNIIAVGCQVGEVNWVANFMSTYAKRLLSKNRENTERYYKGLFYFCTGKWDQALEELSTGEILPQRQHATRSIVVRCLFEKYLLDQTYLDVLLAKLQSNEAFLKRFKLVSTTSIQAHLRFIKLLRQLVLKINAQATRKEIETWFQEATKDVQIHNKKWLKEQIQRL